MYLSTYRIKFRCTKIRDFYVSLNEIHFRRLSTLFSGKVGLLGRNRENLLP